MLQCDVQDVLEAEKNMRLAEIYSKRRLKELQYVL